MKPAPPVTRIRFEWSMGRGLFARRPREASPHGSLVRIAAWLV
jgi:hypothetical protein